MSEMTDWVPDEAELRQVLLILEQSQSPDSTVQRNVQQNLLQLNSHNRFGCYLAYIFGVMTQEQVANRSVAGIILKNNMRTQQWTNLSADVKDYIKTKILSAIGDESPLIRATVGVFLTTVVVEEGLEEWPTLLPTLSQLLHHEETPALQEGALGALQKILEDSGDRLDKETHIEPLLPHVLPFFGSTSPRMRGLAMNSINCILMVHDDDPLSSVIDQFLVLLFGRAQDDDPEVIKQLCRSLTLLLESHLEKLAPYLPSVIEYLITKTADENEAIALEACEFWLALAENTHLAEQIIAPFMAKLVGVLVKCMRYTVDDINLLRANDETEDAMVPDREEDMKPRFHRGKVAGGEEDEDEEDDDQHQEWSVRKCAAASLDAFASIFRETILPHLLPILKDMIGHPQWEVKESAVLALGAVAEGCLDGMKPHLDELVPYLLGLLQDRKALVRSITCWTLSRYCTFVVGENHPYFHQLLKELLARILDGNKRVQEAACSAFATFEEEANIQLVPFLPDIIRTLVNAFGYYQARNLLILYDAVGTLADSVGSHLAKEEYMNTLMTPLMGKMQILPDEDRELFPLLECISSVATALGESFVPFCPVVFTRCTSIVRRCLEKSYAHDMDRENIEAPDKDFMIVSLDLISGLISSIPVRHMEGLIEESHLVHLLLRCAADPMPEVRQSTFAVLGDLVKNCFHLVQPVVNDFTPILVGNIDPELISVCNNSTWALGEMALQIKDGMREYAKVITLKLTAVLARDNVQKTLIENTAMTLGRLGIYCTEDVAPALQYFIRPACYALRNVRDNADKESAFRGICLMVNTNPQGVLADFVFLCDAIASWNAPPEDLKNMFRQILFGFRQSLGEANWQLFTAQFPEILRQRLSIQYAI